jgi:hypothetical protein
MTSSAAYSDDAATSRGLRWARPTRSRRLYVESSDPPSSLVTTDRDLLSAMKTAQHKRDIIIGKRVVVLNQRNNYRYQRDAVHKARNKFLLAAKNLRYFLQQHDLECTEITQLEDAFLELGKYDQHLSLVEEKLQQADRDLDVRESRLSADEKKVYDALGRYVEHSPSHSPARPPKPRSRRSSSSSSDSSIATEPMAREYYTMAGTVKILRERLHNKQVQHLQDILLRQNDMELGRSLQPPEKDFRKTYFIDLSALYAELLTAKKKSAHLRQVCADEDIDLSDIDDEDSHDNSGALHLTLDLDRQLVHHAATVEDIEERCSLLGNFLSGYMDPKTKVQDWLMELPSRNQSEPLGVPETPYFEDFSPALVSEPDTSNAPTSRLQMNSSNTRSTMIPAVPSEQDRIEREMIEWSDVSSKRSLPNSQRSHDFVGEAPKRRYSDSMMKRPPFTNFEEGIYTSRGDQKGPSSESGAFVLDKGARDVLWRDVL